MIQLYECGRKYYRWSGICEYDHTNEQYRYHEDGTIQEQRKWAAMSPAVLADHLAAGWWVLFLPELQVPEGL